MADIILFLDPVPCPQKDYRKAIPFLERAIDIRAKAREPGDPNTVKVRNFLQCLRQKVGAWSTVMEARLVQGARGLGVLEETETIIAMSGTTNIEDRTDMCSEQQLV